MKNLIIFFLLIFVGCKTIGFYGEGPQFSADWIRLPQKSQDSLKVQIYVEIPYRSLQFYRETSEKYSANFEIGFFFRNKNEQIFQEISNHSISVEKYSEAHSRETSTITRIFLMPNQDINFSISVLDKRTGNIRFFREKLSKSPIKNLQVSDIRLGVLNDDRNFVVNISRIFTENVPEITAEFGVLTDEDSVTVKSWISDYKKWSQQNGKFSASEPIQISIPTDFLTYSKYRLNVKISDSKHDAFLQKEFNIHWIALAPLVENIDLAVEQMVYILPFHERVAMRSASVYEKREMFLDFWKKRDPTQETEENELLTEYFRRVAFANQNFTETPTGWKSDRGMVYIIFGEPESIEKRPASFEHPAYEIWYYDKIDKQFVFVDYSGFGNFRLKTPFNFPVDGGFF